MNQPIAAATFAYKENVAKYVCNAKGTKYEILIEVSCYGTNSGNYGGIRILVSYCLALKYYSPYIHIHSVILKAIRVACNDYGPRRHLNTGLDSTPTNIYDNNQ